MRPSAPFAISLIAAAIAAPVVAQNAPTTQGLDESDIETILVIGERDERSLKDTVSSVSVLDGDSLNALRNFSITDAVAEVPNVVALSGAVPDIRGVSGNGSAGGFNSITGGARARVSTLVDGVPEPFVADRTGDSGIWDVQQIEVFRGPQSTLVGRNAIGGMIFVKTKDPTFDWEGAARFAYRNQDQYLDYAAAVSGPVVDDVLAFRISANYLDAQTITDENGFASNPPTYDLNGLESHRVRGKLLWTPSDDARVLLTYSTGEESGDTGRRYYSAANPGEYERIFFRNIENSSDTLSLKVDYDFNANWSADVLLAYQDYDWGFDGYEPDPAAQQYLVFEQDSITIDARLRYASDDDRVSGHIGYAHFERDQDFVSTGAFEYNGADETESDGVYGELSYRLNDRWTLTGGLRVQNEDQQRDFEYTTFGRSGTLDESKTITLPKLVVQYDLNEQTTLGLSAREGYNAPGGAFAFASGDYYYYDEETVRTLEFSVRSGSADGRFSVRANVFYNDYDGYQALNTNREIVNMEEAVTYGLEVEFNAQLTDHLALRGGLGLLETDIKDAGDEYAAADGNELNSAPPVTGNVGLTYSFAMGLELGIFARYVDEYYGDVLNTDERVAGDYTLTSLSANYYADNWHIAAFVNNALDSDEFITREPPGRTAPEGYVAVLDPRSVGLSVTYQF